MAKEHEVLNRRWRRSIADIVRHGRSTGEFPEGLDADELGIQIGAVVDGLAIQVLMDHGDVTPEDMLRVSREVSAKLIGFAAGARPASLSTLCRPWRPSPDPRRRHRCRRRARVALRGRVTRGRPDRRHVRDGQHLGRAGDGEHARGAGGRGARRGGGRAGGGPAARPRPRPVPGRPRGTRTRPGRPPPPTASPSSRIRGRADRRTRRGRGPARCCSSRPGPLTNIALALREEPGLPAAARAASR